MLGARFGPTLPAAVALSLRPRNVVAELAATEHEVRAPGRLCVHAVPQLQSSQTDARWPHACRPLPDPTQQTPPQEELAEALQLARVALADVMPIYDAWLAGTKSSTAAAAAFAEAVDGVAPLLSAWTGAVPDYVAQGPSVATRLEQIASDMDGSDVDDARTARAR